MHFYTIKREDVGKRFLRCLGRTWWLSDSIGYVQAIDVGKRLYLRGGIIQAENDEQMKRRLAVESK